MFKSPESRIALAFFVAMIGLVAACGIAYMGMRCMENDKPFYSQTSEMHF
jgi:hypothetical protein